MMTVGPRWRGWDDRPCQADGGGVPVSHPPARQTNAEESYFGTAFDYPWSPVLASNRESRQRYNRRNRAKPAVKRRRKL